MAKNYPGPYELEYQVQVQGLRHWMRYSVIALDNPQTGQAAGTVTLLTRGGNAVPVTTAVSNFWGQRARFLYKPADTLVSATLWRYLPNSYEKVFITQVPIDSPQGAQASSALVTQLAHQNMITFRSAAGGIAKLVFLETVFGGDLSVSVALAGSNLRDIANWAVSADSHIIARDNGFLILPLRVSQGQNEAIWRKRYRPNQ